MKVQSAKAKGRQLQQLVRDKVLEAYPSLTDRDVKSVPLGVNGPDLELSTAAFKLFPYAVECKRNKAFSIYKAFEQQGNSPGEDVLVIRGDRKPALAIITLDHFMELQRGET